MSLDLARQRLTETRVVSPVDGVVTQRAVQIGQIISSGISNVGGGTTALVVSDLSRIFVLAAVDESDIGQVRPGQRVKVTVDAYRNREFAGEVVRISPRGVNVSNVVTFEVKIEVTARDKELLRPEMTANVEILIDERPDALLAPSDAHLPARRQDLGHAAGRRRGAHRPRGERRDQRRAAHRDPLGAHRRRDGAGPGLRQQVERAGRSARAARR